MKNKFKNLMTNNTKINKLIQSAGNFTKNLNKLICINGSSETTRQLSDKKILNNTKHKKFIEVNNKNEKFIQWFAGILDGNGNFDLRKHPVHKHLILKAIRIKIHIRDIRILTRIKDFLHIGIIRYDKKKPYVTYSISVKNHMESVITLVNGLILIKVEKFKKACIYFNINFKEGNYIISPLNHYFAGLIDSEGSIVFNYVSNRIECALELKYTIYTKKLIFDYVIPNYKPYISLREKIITGKPGKKYKSILFKYQNVNEMIFLYSAFMKMRLYCDFKFYRVTLIKKFLLIRHYKNSDNQSLEFKIYKDFVLQWVKYLNPLYVKIPFVIKLLQYK